MQTRINKLLRSIVPIETTAEDVKRLLGEPVSKSPDFHKSDDFNVLISYTSGLSCEKQPTYGWKVPRDRVISFTVIVKTAFHQKDLQNLGIDLSKYEKKEGGHIPETSYDNREEGIGIILNGDQVMSIDLFPPKKYLHLMCPRADKPPDCTSRKSVGSLR